MIARRLVAPAAAAATAAAAFSHNRAQNSSAPEYDYAAAERLRNVAMRARDTLGEPPAILRRCARAAWRTHASDEAVECFDTKRLALHKILTQAAQAWKATGSVDESTLDGLDHAAVEAESAVHAVRASAVEGASSVAWDAIVGGTKLERADGTENLAGGGGQTSVESLGGKVVALYFTASWCGPCRRFTPKLVDLYERVRGVSGGGSDFEVVLVSWDERQADKEAYAQSHGMRWLALPHEKRNLADELTLRYDVQFIPTLVVVEISEDGKAAKVLSTDGRMEVERGDKTDWLQRVAPPSGGGGGGKGWLR